MTPAPRPRPVPARYVRYRSRRDRNAVQRRVTAARRAVAYADTSPDRPRGWRGVLDLGRAVWIDQEQLDQLRIRFRLAAGVTVQAGAACLRARIADTLRADGIAPVHSDPAGTSGTRCPHGDCAACTSWPDTTRTVEQLIGRALRSSSDKTALSGRRESGR